MRMNKKEIKAYMLWVVNERAPVCQRCGAQTQDAHHILYGAYKDDRYLVGLCRSCHDWAHRNKRESQATLLRLGEANYKLYLKEKHEHS